MSFLDDIIDPEKAQRWIDQNTPEWDAARLGRFTASEIWKLMVKPKTIVDQEAGKLAETALTYIQEKAAEIMTGVAKQQGYAFPLVWGIEKEPEAVAWFEQVTGLETERVGFFPFTDHAGGSPDRQIKDNPLEIVEAKCPYDSSKQIDYLTLTDYHDLKRDFREHYWQSQSNLLFTGAELCHFITFDPRMIDDSHKMAYIKIPKVEADQLEITKQIGKAVKEKLIILARLKPKK